MFLFLCCFLFFHLLGVFFGFVIWISFVSHVHTMLSGGFKKMNYSRRKQFNRKWNFNNSTNNFYKVVSTESVVLCRSYAAAFTFWEILFAIVAERMFACSMMGNGNVAPDAMQQINIDSKWNIFSFFVSIWQDDSEKSSNVHHSI